MGIGKLIEAHLQHVYDQTLTYLQQEHDKEKYEASGGLAIEEIGDVEPPGAYIEYLMMRRVHNLHYWCGGWADQPYLLYLEIDRCIVAEQEFHKIQDTNRRLREEYSQNKESRDNG